jgi:hypothetical protein
MDDRVRKRELELIMATAPIIHPSYYTGVLIFYAIMGIIARITNFTTAAICIYVLEWYVTNC